MPARPCRLRESSVKGRIYWRLLSVQFLEKIPARISIAQRIVVDVAVAVEVLRVVRRLDVGVRRDEPPQFRVVDPAVHVDQAQPVQVSIRGRLRSIAWHLRSSLRTCDKHALLHEHSNGPFQP